MSETFDSSRSRKSGVAPMFLWQPASVSLLFLVLLLVHLDTTIGAFHAHLSRRSERPLSVTRILQFSSLSSDESSWDAPSDNASFIARSAQQLHHRIIGATPYSTDSTIIQNQLTMSNSHIQSSRKSTLKQLFWLTRPTSTPGIIAFHLLGCYLACPMTFTTTNYLKVLQQQSIVATWISLILVSASSMVVNDLDDAMLGRDVHKVSVSLQSLAPAITKRFLRFLYVSIAVVSLTTPGHVTRGLTAMGVAVTWLYTKYLKPVTWLKNVVCAMIISLAPLTSGVATWEYLNQQAAITSTGSWRYFLVQHAALLRVVAVIFFGVMSREMMMDCNDVPDDRRANVETVPVKYGRYFASKAVMATSMAMAILAMAGPLAECKTLATMPLAVGRRLALATIASGMFLRRSWKVLRTRGQDKPILDAAVDEALLTVLIGLASFV